VDDSSDLNKAVILYLGHGMLVAPLPDRSRLVLMFGEQRATELEPLVKGLLSEIGSIQIDWNTLSLDAGGRFARSEMQRRHGELSDEALAALEWKFTFDWR